MRIPDCVSTIYMGIDPRRALPHTLNLRHDLVCSARTLHTVYSDGPGD